MNGFLTNFLEKWIELFPSGSGTVYKWDSSEPGTYEAIVSSLTEVVEKDGTDYYGECGTFPFGWDGIAPCFFFVMNETTMIKCHSDDIAVEYYPSYKNEKTIAIKLQGMEDGILYSVTCTTDQRREDTILFQVTKFK